AVLRNRPARRVHFGSVLVVVRHDAFAPDAVGACLIPGVRVEIRDDLFEERRVEDELAPAVALEGARGGDLNPDGALVCDLGGAEPDVCTKNEAGSHAPSWGWGSVLSAFSRS